MALTPDEKQELLKIAEELSNAGKESTRREAPALNLKDGTDVVYKLLGIAASLVLLILWIGSLRGDIATNREALIAVRLEVAAARVEHSRLEERLRLQEQKMARLEK